MHETSPLGGDIPHYDITGTDTARWLMAWANRTIDRRLLGIKVELDDPAVESVLTALFPGNPLVRSRDYDLEDRTWEYPTIDPYVGFSYAASDKDPLRTAEVATEVREGITRWRSFLTETEPSEVVIDQPLSSRAARAMDKKLRPSPTVVLERFRRSQTRLLSQTMDSHEDVAHDVQLQQTMLPIALYTMAYDAFPDGDTPSSAKNHRFALELSFSMRDIDKPDRLRARIGFESENAAMTYMSAVGMLRKLFTAGDDLDFVDRLIEQHLLQDMGDLLEGAAFFTKPTQLIDSVVHTTTQMAHQLGYDNKVVNARIKALLKEYDVYKQRSVSGNNSGAKPADGSDDWRTLVRSFVDMKSSNHAAFLTELQCVIQTSILVPRTILEQIHIHALDPLLAIADAKPMAELAQRVQEVRAMLQDFEVIEELRVDFEVAPPHIGMRGPRSSDTRSATATQRNALETRQPTSDMERRERLKEVIRIWGRGVFAWSKIPNLPPRRQYYMALLPQELENGETIWHVVADNVQLGGRHAMLVWRAESGMDKYGHTRRSWDVVFRWHKDEMKRAGMVGLRHTDTLEDRLLRLLLAPTESMPRYEHYGDIALRGTVSNAPRALNHKNPIA